ncbi:hypothetical protein FQN51_005836 [Onygenales sp. PD_10]|nr:hypothetical protein FQN51_005836 [Onygenales sp. PD_10]
MASEPAEKAIPYCKNHRCVFCDECVPEFPEFVGPHNPSLGPLAEGKFKGCARRDLPLMFPVEIKDLNEIGFTADTSGEGALSFPTYFHGDCFKLLAQGKTDPLMSSKLNHLCAALVPLFKMAKGNPSVTDDFTLHCAVQKMAEERGWANLSAGERESKPCGDDDALTELLYDIWRKFPAEVNVDIWRYLKPCGARSLINTQIETRKLLEQTRIPTGPTTGTIKLDKSIQVYLTTIRGFQYICGIHDGLNRVGHESDKSCEIVLPAEIFKIKTVLGPYGLGSLGFLGKTSSVWAGDYTKTKSIGKWLGMYASNKPIRKLDVDWDALKITSVSNPANIHHAPEHLYFWGDDLSDICLPFNNITVYHTANVKNYWARFFEEKQLSLARVLPLVKRNCTLYGLTAFCDDSGAIIGFRSDFTSSENPGNSVYYCIGDQSGIPLHFRLAQHEKVTFVWGYEKADAEVQVPGLVVGTDWTRTVAFGPLFRTGEVNMTKIAHQLDGTIVGFFYTDNKVIRGNQISEIGTICQKSGPCYHAYAPASHPFTHVFPPPSYSDEVIPTFAGEGTFKHISRVMACYRDGRCSGLLLYHDKHDVVEVVGRWYEADRESHLVIYEGSPQHQPNKLRFYLDGVEPSVTVYDVGVLAFEDSQYPPYTGERKILEITYGDAFVWWFMKDADMIRLL